MGENAQVECRNRSGVPERPDRSEFRLFSAQDQRLADVEAGRYETGLDTYLYNGGELTNRGFEIALSAKVLDTKPFKWNAELGIARYKNEISALPDGDYTTEILGGEVLTAVGHPAGVFYGYEAHGVYATEAEAQAARLKVQHEDASYTYFHAGDVRFADLHADGVLDERG